MDNIFIYLIPLLILVPVLIYGIYKFIYNSKRKDIKIKYQPLQTKKEDYILPCMWMENNSENNSPQSDEPNFGQINIHGLGAFIQMFFIYDKIAFVLNLPNTYIVNSNTSREITLVIGDNNKITVLANPVENYGWTWFIEIKDPEFNIILSQMQTNQKLFVHHYAFNTNTSNLTSLPKNGAPLIVNLFSLKDFNQCWTKAISEYQKYILENPSYLQERNNIPLLKRSKIHKEHKMILEKFKDIKFPKPTNKKIKVNNINQRGEE